MLRFVWFFGNVLLAAVVTMMTLQATEGSLSVPASVTVDNPRRMLQENAQETTMTVGTSNSMYPIGTDVWWKFDDVWYEGTIIDSDESVPNYTIRWEDDEIVVYTDMQQVDEMVSNAYLDDDDEEEDDDDDDDDDYTDLSLYNPWPTGTFVLMEFTSGWYEGEISSFEKVNETYAFYQIDWTDGTTGQYSDLVDVDEMVQNAQEYEPWPDGTPVFNENGELDEDLAADLEGQITAFASGVYTIEWSTGQQKDYKNFDDVDDMVAAANRKNGASDFDDDAINYEPWEIGTEVSYEFDDGWWDGTISGFNEDDMTYEVTWSDGSVNTYYDLRKIDQMVDDAQDDDEFADEDDEGITDDDDVESEYEIGTRVYQEFDDGWWVGNIVSNENGVYTVRWADNSFDTFDADSQELADIVYNAQNMPDDVDVKAYPIGTPVYRQFEDDIWYHGVIISYQDFMYTVEWEDATSTRHPAGAEMDAMVAAGAPTKGMSAAGIAFLSIFVLSASFGVAYFFIKKHAQRKQITNKNISPSAEEIAELDKKPSGYVV
ncbi:hypothetical protein IV203_021308 [Nitzschia inconspicua]|uniref:Uncharacterized protein n=1 Tax=Nitzschia inconspicua TaxID=303405 RepID=A0A9K3PDA8_9STRA|nr:hypothetical protein IV203_021308 [Nitzschia inconspicua]